MPRIASLTNSLLTGNVTYAVPESAPQYFGIELNNTSYNEGAIITATVSTANVVNGTTVAYTVTGISANDLSAGSLTGTITISSNTGTATFTLANDGLTEGTDTFTITLAATDSVGTSTGSLADSASILDTSNDPTTSLWLDDNDAATTVRLIIGATSMQINGVFSSNPSVPRTIEGRTSGTRTTITAITARTANYIEVDDTGNSTNFVVGERLNLVLGPTLGSVYEGGYYIGDVTYTDGRQFRLVVVPFANQSSQQWKTVGTNSFEASSADDGFANTDATNNATHPAAQYARSLTVGGFTDWYIASNTEWNVMQTNRASLPVGQTFSNQLHWMSRNGADFSAWQINPIAGSSGFGSKTSPLAVRAIRRIAI